MQIRTENCLKCISFLTSPIHSLMSHECMTHTPVHLQVIVTVLSKPDKGEQMEGITTPVDDDETR